MAGTGKEQGFLDQSARIETMNRNKVDKSLCSLI